MQTIFKFSFASILLLAIMLMSCNDQGELGDDIIDASRIGVFTDDWPFTAVTRSTDSVDSRKSLGHFLVGRIDENVFGIYNASFYTQFSLNVFDRVFDQVEVDSVFLELTYDTLASYGLDDEEFDVYVYRLEQDPDEAIDIYSNITLDVSDLPVGVKENFIPEIVSETNDTNKIRNAGVLRIPLDISLGEELLSYDSISYSSAIDFREKFRGIYVTGSDDNQAMLGFQLAENFRSTRLVVHYRDLVAEDTLEFTLRIASQDYRLPKFDKDQSTGIVGGYVDDEELSKELLFISGLAGNFIEMDMKAAALELEDKLLNDAEVCFTLNDVEFSYDYELYPAVQSVSGSFYSASGDLFQILGQGVSRLTTDSTANNMEYCINITAQLQSIARRGFDDRIILRPLFRESNPRRSILYGTDHPDYPAKLKVYYTKPD